VGKSDRSREGGQMSELESRVNQLSALAKERLAIKLQKNGPQRLIAAYVPDRPSDKTASDKVCLENNADCQLENMNLRVKTALANRLPRHMLPDFYVQLDEIPKLTNGKLDHATLDRLTQKATTAQAKNQTTIPDPDPIISNESDISKLIEILEDTIGFTGIRPSDNFFELGGDSLSAIRFVSRAREANIPISVAQLGTQATLIELVKAAEQQKALPQKNVPDRFGEAPLTPIQSWFFSIPHPHPNHWNIGGHFSIKGSVDANELQQAVHNILSSHTEFGVQFNQLNGEWSANYLNNKPERPLCKLIQADSSNASFTEFVKQSSGLFQLEHRKPRSYSGQRIIYLSITTPCSHYYRK